MSWDREYLLKVNHTDCTWQDISIIWFSFLSWYFNRAGCIHCSCTSNLTSLLWTQRAELLSTINMLVYKNRHTTYQLAPGILKKNCFSFNNIFTFHIFSQTTNIFSFECKRKWKTICTLEYVKLHHIWKNYLKRFISP